jgi:hypothetical protein
MANRDEHTFDFLTGREGDYMESVIGKLADTPWSKPLVDDINATGGLCGDNKAKLFELRFGYAVHQADIQPKYEVAGEGQSTLDFGFKGGDREFLVEMMRLEETDAVKAATTVEEFSDGAVMVGRSLSTTAEDHRQSEEGETLKAVERICQKCEKDGKPHKFPPIEEATHVLLVDMRTFLNGGDEWDRVHVGLGGKHVSQFHRRYWKENLISGVFSPETKLRGAPEARERVHFIGFVNEKDYADGAIGPAIQFIANPNLFKTPEEARAALAGWPLGEPDILNARKKKASANVQKLADAMSSLTVSEAAELAKLLQAKWHVTVPGLEISPCDIGPLALYIS